jgi:hypothetical protein
VSRRTRVFVVVAVAALVAAVAAVGAVLLLDDEEQRGSGPRPGVPPLVLDLGVRTDPEAVALRRAERLYADDKRDQARAVFARFDSPEAEIGSAFSTWPGDAVARLERLASEHPRDARILLHLGFAHFWAGRDAEAVADWRRAASFAVPADVQRFDPQEQLAVLARRARGRDVRAKLIYGVALQRVGRPVSARREFDAAARLAPGNAEPHVAAAVARFDKASPSAAFSRLGPLARRFPRSQSVRFHLGLLLLWLARVQQNALAEGKSQLTRARDLGPQTSLGREAKRLLDSLEGVETR